MSDSVRIFALAAPIVLLIGVDKGGFAGAFGLVAVPVIALIVPPFEAAPLLLPVLVAMDGYGVCAYRKTWSRPLLGPLLAGGAVGLAAGVVLAERIPDGVARLVMGVMALVFAAMTWLPRSTRDAQRSSPVTGYGALCGALSGFGSFLAHAGGPPIQMFMLSQRVDRRVFVGTSVMFFAVLNAAKVVAYSALGWFDLKRLWIALCLVPLGPAGIALGRAAVERLPDRHFHRVARVFLAIVGAKLLSDGLEHRLGKRGESMTSREVTSSADAHGRGTSNIPRGGTLNTMIARHDEVRGTHVRGR